MGAPNTVEISITTVWDRPTSDATTVDLDFGDGSASAGLSGAATYTGTTSLGQGYTVQQTTVTHVYAANGTYALVLSGCCRHATTNNTDGTLPFRLTDSVALGSGMSHGPAWLTIEPTMTDGGNPGVYIPTAFGDVQDPTAREATQLESGLAIPALPDHTGATTTPMAIVNRREANVYAEWLASYQTGETYELAFVVSDARGGSSAIDLIAEVTASAGDSFTPDVYELGGAPGDIIMDGGWNVAGTTVTLANLPGATITADATRWAISWTPAPADLGTYRVAVLDFVMSDGIRTEIGVAVYVQPQVDECTNGTADCAPIVASCRDQPWGYSCLCNSNFSGDGRTCTAICTETPLGGCLTPTGKASATCCGDPTTGSSTCTCPSDTTTAPSHAGCGGCATSDGCGAALALVVLGARRRRRRLASV
jgi:hypothetical protein